ncbi:MGMT family protein [Clostridium pasteurianum]|uniref:O-6-methylguanine DNA methyltransferase n=1 Tax=Clostridium pasteurianum BC1 TaxID=86416 RepID=R4K6A4_CLOPA|nr:O-6-methylguanine DNA methyltransferase [Clostridium pasteurianum BC1]
MEKYFDTVYKIVAKIPRGKIATYGLIAALLGNPRSARIVGYAMRSAPRDLNLPCHRVVNKTGELAADYIFGDKKIQRAMLENEGITFNNNGHIIVEKHLWDGK